MHNDRKYIHDVETTEGPATEAQQDAPQKSMGFSYRRGIGELIYAMVTCRPDISYSVIKLSQYSQRPAQIHYKAVKGVFYYLKATKTRKFTYWRTKVNHQLPTLEIDLLQNKETTHDPTEPDNTTLHGCTDSDWGGDKQHRQSVTGYLLKLAGGCIVYKSKYQHVIAPSSSKAEYQAACDAGKAILYLRSILARTNWHRTTTRHNPTHQK
jgi:hypothetical protein